MNYYTYNDLISSLDDLTTFKVLELNENSKVVISEYGGRPIGIFPHINSYSMMWINPNLKETISNNRRDIGGDRYWISPERLFFYRNPENWEGWFCPDKLDPAHYKIMNASKQSCKLKTSIQVENQLTKEMYNGNITRDIKLIDDPLSSALNFCGIEYNDVCTLNKPNLKVNGWSLTNIISGGPENPGTVLIPTKHKAKPLSYFRAIPNERLIIEKDYIGFKIDVFDIYKLAIRPEDIDFSKKAKIGYILNIPESKSYGLIIKLSDDIPKSQDECFDVARDHPESEIGVIQSYNSESPKRSELRYGEIELQLDIFKTKNGNSVGEATHQLLAYIGSKNEIFHIIEKLLKIRNPKLF
ncbi:MAG: DUF6786 family protein [Promethearchaeati archaeon]